MTGLAERPHVHVNLLTHPPLLDGGTSGCRAALLSCEAHERCDQRDR